jgi:hypothetical protein
MQHWNVVESLHERRYVPARKLLEKLGTVSRTAYFNVLVMHVEDTGGLLETLRQWAEENPLKRLIVRWVCRCGRGRRCSAMRFSIWSADAIRAPSD